jgi:hypothetical protein
MNDGKRAGQNAEKWLPADARRDDRQATYYPTDAGERWRGFWTALFALAGSFVTFYLGLGLLVALFGGNNQGNAIG